MGAERLCPPLGGKRKGAVKEEEGAMKGEEEEEGGAPMRLCDTEQHVDGDPRGDEERPEGTDGEEEEKEELE